MWTQNNRPRYNRDHLRYPSNLTDEEWACRERAERDASPTAAIIDSQSVKGAEKGGPTLIRTALTPAS